jgi:hypothetical protein
MQLMEVESFILNIFRLFDFDQSELRRKLLSIAIFEFYEK